jgi:transposase
MLHARGGGFAHKVPLREGFFSKYNFLCSRRLGGLGHEVRLMPAQYVKA